MQHDRLATILYHQDSIITRSQALSLGLSEGVIRHAITKRRNWQVVIPGIYATFTGPLRELHRLRAAVLYAGPESVVTGAAACRLHRLSYVPAWNGLDVVIPTGMRRRDAEFVSIHRTMRLPAPTYWCDGDIEAMRRAQVAANDPLTHGALRGQIPIAPPARAALDAAGFLHAAVKRAFGDQLPTRHRNDLVRDTRALFCEVVQRRKASVNTMLEEFRAAQSRGRSITSLALDDIAAGCRSAPECELRDLFKRSTILPEPRWNQPLPGYRPKNRQQALTPDACLREARLVVEVDSVEWHRIGTRQELTEKRRSRYAELGWLVISVSPYRIRHEPDEVLREIEQAYLANRNR